jgi:hypothetical protein
MFLASSLAQDLKKPLDELRGRVWIECWMLCCRIEVLSRYQFERDFVICVC